MSVKAPDPILVLLQEWPEVNLSQNLWGFTKTYKIKNDKWRKLGKVQLWEPRRRAQGQRQATSDNHPAPENSAHIQYYIMGKKDKNTMCSKGEN